MAGNKLAELDKDLMLNNLMFPSLANKKSCILIGLTEVKWALPPNTIPLPLVGTLLAQLRLRTDAPKGV